MGRLHYLAYGSNLHPRRLAERVPSARPLGVVQLPGLAIEFRKRSNTTDSAKCDLAPAPTAVSHGVLYEMAAGHRHLLDRAEGFGEGYDAINLTVMLGGVTYTPFVYLAQPTHITHDLKPFHWYKALVVAGARHHRLPDRYIARLEAVSSVPDPEHGRAAEHEALLMRL